MEVRDAIRTRLEVREYSDKPIDAGTRNAILEAARLAPSGRNRQHWRFIVITEQDDLDRLAELSMTGDWIDDAAFAVVVTTDPTHGYHEIDAGRAITHMQFAAWETGVGSCIYTGFDSEGMRSFLDVPSEYAITAVVGFGWPPFDVDAVQGRKDRAPLSTVVYVGRFGRPYEVEP